MKDLKKILEKKNVINKEKKNQKDARRKERKEERKKEIKKKRIILKMKKII